MSSYMDSMNMDEEDVGKGITDKSISEQVSARMLYCTICGGPIITSHHGELAEPHIWLRNIYVLSLLDDSKFAKKGIDSGYRTEDRDIGIMPAWAGPTHNFQSFVVPGSKHARHQFAFHCSCQEKVERFFAFARQPDIASAFTGKVTSWADLYLAMEAQLETDTAGSENIAEMSQALGWWHRYFGGSAFPKRKWQQNTPQEAFEVEVDPTHSTFNVTDWLIPRLQPVQSASSSSELTPQPRNLTDEFSCMVIDLQTFVSQALSNAENPSKDCTRKYSPQVWIEIFIKITPWLWNLSRGHVYWTDLRRDPANGQLVDWDWEALARQLAETEIFEPGNGLEDAPPFLRNKRRI